VNEKKDVEYKYIEIVTSTQKKIIDFNIIQKFVNLEKLYSNLSEEIYDYLVEIFNAKKENPIILDRNF
jgi:hypothetical protein